MAFAYYYCPNCVACFDPDTYTNRCPHCNNEMSKKDADDLAQELGRLVSHINWAHQIRDRYEKLKVEAKQLQAQNLKLQGDVHRFYCPATDQMLASDQVSESHTEHAYYVATATGDPCFPVTAAAIRNLYRKVTQFADQLDARQKQALLNMLRAAPAHPDGPDRAKREVLL